MDSSQGDDSRKVSQGMFQKNPKIDEVIEGERFLRFGLHNDYRYVELRCLIYRQFTLSSAASSPIELKCNKDRTDSRHGDFIIIETLTCLMAA